MGRRPTALSSISIHTVTSERCAGHFGTMLGSPPSVPGGGTTGVVPPPTSGTAMPGSTPAGGQMMPLERESRSPRSTLLSGCWSKRQLHLWVSLWPRPNDRLLQTRLRALGPLGQFGPGVCHGKQGRSVLVRHRLCQLLTFLGKSPVGLGVVLHRWPFPNRIEPRPKRLKPASGTVVSSFRAELMSGPAGTESASARSSREDWGVDVRGRDVQATCC
jgi:hypothetical protein